jgi:hypothetical protein
MSTGHPDVGQNLSQNFLQHQNVAISNSQNGAIVQDLKIRAEYHYYM